MNYNFTIATLFPLLLDKAREVALVATSDFDRFEGLRYFAEDVRMWLDEQPDSEREDILQKIELYLRDGNIQDMPRPQDSHEELCFQMLLSIVLEPPPLLL